MIFVTVGSLFPFDRLVRLVDELAPTMPEQQFFAQIFTGAYEPVNMPYARLVTRREFTEKMLSADVIVAHAGMGSVISAMEMGKPVVLVPRVFEWGEHTTDHQMATARWLEGRPGINVCIRGEDLGATIAHVLAQQQIGEAMPRAAPEPFIQKIRDFIAS
jgi:exopolysaccharide biosynthesis glucuronosyltransferase PssE